MPWWWCPTYSVYAQIILVTVENPRLFISKNDINQSLSCWSCSKLHMQLAFRFFCKTYISFVPYRLKCCEKMLVSRPRTLTFPRNLEMLQGNLLMILFVAFREVYTISKITVTFYYYYVKFQRHLNAFIQMLAVMICPNLCFSVSLPPCCHRVPRVNRELEEGRKWYVRSPQM